MVTFFASIILALAASADQGSVTNELRLDSPGGTMEKVTVRNQGFERDCFAHTAAQMVDAWRFSHGDQDFEFQTSGLLIAAQANRDQNDWEFDSGEYIGETINVVQGLGICNRDVVLDSLSVNAVDRAIAILKSWRNAARKARRFEKKNFDKSMDALYTITKSVDHPAILPARTDIQRVFEEVNPHAQIETILGSHCTGENHKDVALPKLQQKIFPALDAKKIPAIISGLLTDTTSQPVGITYCERVLNFGNYQGVLKNGAERKDCQSHASIVIGKRVYDGAEQFLVRNSHGTNCGGFDFWPCDDKGNYWIDARRLSVNVSEIAYFPVLSH